MKFTRRLFALGASAVVLACGEIPVLPQWDADWYLPIPSQNFSFRKIANNLPSVPNNTTYPFSSDTLPQDIDESMGQVLGQDLKAASIILTLRKTINLFTSDTLFIANSPANLNPGGAGTIVLPLNMTTADRTVVDTIVVSNASLAMLRTAADANGTLYITFRGRAGNNSGSAIAVSDADSLGVRIAIVARIAVSK